MKPLGIASTSARMRDCMRLRCRCSQPHEVVRGNATRKSALYTRTMSKRVVPVFLSDEEIKEGGGVKQF